jgi:hypothetical protein
MTRFIKIFLYKLSRALYSVIPDEIKKNRHDIYELYDKEQQLNSYNYFKNYFKNSVLLKNATELRKYSILKAKEQDKLSQFYNLEFGVFDGTSINFFSNYVKNIYGFDSFEGLKEDWTGNLGFTKGHFDLKKKLPKVNKNIKLIDGFVQDTLGDFLEKKDMKINFVHMDLDTYESSLFVLRKIKPYLTKNAIIVFDELHNFVGWDTGEFKALKEVFDDSEYEYIAFSMEHQATIKVH